MAATEYALFEDRFLESFVGSSIFRDPKVAIIELIANAWDAGATEVTISWPENDDELFLVKDNGHGMTDSQFRKRFQKLAYNRSREQGQYAEIPQPHQDKIGKRPTFGRNGKGRLAAFAFGDEFFVKTTREGFQNIFKVFQHPTHNQLAFQKVGNQVEMPGSGTEIYVEHALKTNLSSEDGRREIGMRFLTDPHFKVKLNNVEITFDDIPEECISKIPVEIDGIGTATITVIDVQTTDKSTQQHGIAWHVKRRLVGECTWKGSGSEHLIDGRKTAAKRYIFIVEADFLEDVVAPDWTTFYPTDNKWKVTSKAVFEKIKDHILELSQEQRAEAFNDVEQANRPVLKNIGIVKREKWEKFIKEVQEECPSITADDLQKVGTLLANLEATESKYSLIHTLANATPEELENLGELLAKWDIDLAKIVLDEIEYRTTLLEKLQARVLSHLSDEVLDLQPLFHRGLWIFGPEYETIEYTSNQGMTAVVQKLYGSKEKASGNRPDFAILPDSTVGLYSLPKYDDDGGEIGTDRLTIVELKKPGIPIADEQKSQAWKYVSELYDKGLLKPYSVVNCFVLGSAINPNDDGYTTHKNGAVKILPLDYDTVIRRAKSRLLNLYNKIKTAPFLEDTRMKQYMLDKAQQELF
ncbi:MAG: ATP-binding protein [Chitinophagales bacterium]|nr:ATP-binding protein [Chitinophagales bacterium]